MTAFLGGDRKKCVRIKQPERFKKITQENLVCRLQKAVHELKKASRCWIKIISTFLTKTLALEPNPASGCLYPIFVDHTALMIAMYVDDLLAACSCPVGLQSIKSALCRAFRVRDLNESGQFFRLSTVHSIEVDSLWLLQKKIH